MTDMTAFVQQPGLSGAAPVYTQCTASDFFTAAPGANYLLHYKNGATPTGIVKVLDPATPIPPGSTAVAGFADLQVSTSILAAAERLVQIQNANRFRDATGKVQMTNGTPTTLTVCIIGPL